MLPSIEARIRKLAQEGLSRRAIAREVGVSHTSVGTVLKRAPAASPAPGEPHDEFLQRVRANRPAVTQPDAPASPELSATDALALVRELIQENHAQHRECTKVGDGSNAQRYARTVATLAPVLARLEREAQSERDTLTISRAEIDEAMASVMTKVRAYEERPLLCSACSCALSMYYGGKHAE